MYTAYHLISREIKEASTMNKYLSIRPLNNFDTMINRNKAFQLAIIHKNYLGIFVPVLIWC